MPIMITKTLGIKKEGLEPHKVRKVREQTEVIMIMPRKQMKKRHTCTARENRSLSKIFLETEQEDGKQNKARRRKDWYGSSTYGAISARDRTYG